MRYNGSRWLLLLAAMVLVVGLPLAGKWLRSGAPPRCALDGLTIVPLYRVRIIDEAGTAHDLCCIHCAERWLERQEKKAKAIYVTDESTGQEIAVKAAWFVRSMVTTNPITGNRTHAFGSQAAAEEHSRAFRGLVLSGAERPLPN